MKKIYVEPKGYFTEEMRRILDAAEGKPEEEKEEKGKTPEKKGGEDVVEQERDNNG